MMHSCIPSGHVTSVLSNEKLLLTFFLKAVNGHRKQLRVTEYQQNCFLCLAFIDAR